MSSAGIAWEATPRDRNTERARDFHFAVTWSALSAHLGPLHTAEQIFTRSAELVPAAAVATIEKRSPAPRKAEAEPKARWEMVVPKMDRSALKRPTPVPVLLPRPEEAPPGGRDLSIAKIVSALRKRQRQGKRAEIA